MNIDNRRPLLSNRGLWAVLAAFTLHTSAFGHVKWFSRYTFLDRPLTLKEALTPSFFTLALLSLYVLGLLVFLEQQLVRIEWYKKVKKFLDQFSHKGTLIIRIAAGAVLLLSWQSDTLLMPDLAGIAPWVAWYEFFLALLLLIPRAVPLAGAGLISLFGIGLMQFGLFHMLDHALFLGVGYFLLYANAPAEKIKKRGLNALSISLGFTICWLALEKIIYPQWGLALLKENPQLTLGFSPEFFLLATSFVEFSLGFMLIFGLLRRPVAAIIPMVFLLTTLVFGKTEVIGHTIIYAILAVILIQDSRREEEALKVFLTHTGKRMAYTSAAFSVLLAAMIVVYAGGALRLYEEYLSQASQPTELLQAVESEHPPSLALTVHEDPMAGWNLQLNTENFTFTPDACGGPHSEGGGHAHLYINGQKAARIYGPWFHLSGLDPGTYTLNVTLYTNDHRAYAVGGKPITASYTLVVR